ncbi:MAG: flagellar basal-body rod protein FlgG [Chloroflexi bacterium]|nr:flagellar basal-body rod protein FlgG [Chloroflexota bacterium]
MLSILRNAASGLIAQQWNMDVIGNNMANATTPGFKKGRADFEDLVYQLLQPEAPAVDINGDTPASGGAGTALNAAQMILSQGDLQQTDNPLDVAIVGEGYFDIQKPDGTHVYTRDGSFVLDDQGRLSTHSGYLVPGITVPADTETLGIAQDGTVTIMRAGALQPEQIGQIPVVTFPNPSGLQLDGENLLTPTAASGQAVTGAANTGLLVQGQLENSNVNYAEEMTKLINAQRAYQLSARSLQTVSDMIGLANQLRT